MAEKIYRPSVYLTNEQPAPNTNSPRTQAMLDSSKSHYLASVDNILVDADKVESEIYSKIMLGIKQVEEGIKIIKSQKQSVNADVWDSLARSSYIEYLTGYISYMEEVHRFFETLAKKIINSTEIFQEMEAEISRTIDAGADISGWRLD